MNTNPYAPPNAPLAVGARSGPITPERADQIRRQLRAYNLLSFLLGIPGMGLQVVGRMGGIIGALASLVGTGLLVGGLIFYAKLRGRSPVYSILGLLSCFGMLILYFLPKYCLNCQTRSSYGKKQCGACGGPLGM